MGINGILQGTSNVGYLVSLDKLIVVVDPDVSTMYSLAVIIDDILQELRHKEDNDRNHHILVYISVHIYIYID